VTLLVHRDEAVAVTIEGHAEVGAGPEHLLLQRFRMEGAGAEIDILAVRAGVHHAHVGAEPTEDLGGHPVGGAVSAVEHHAQPSQVVRTARPHVIDVVGLGRVVLHEPSDMHAGRPRGDVAAAQPRLDLLLPGVGELGALRGEDLDAVVLERVVRGREDHAPVGLETAGEIGDGRRGKHPDRVHVTPRRQRPRDERALEHGPREPGVAPDHQPSLGGAVVLQQGRH
jgi:hypothetical protein